MKQISKLAALILIFILPELSSARDIMKWAFVDFPPYYIFQGDDKGMGRDERLIRLIQKHLPAYRHLEQKMPAARLFGRLKAGEHLCVVSLYRTPGRSEFISYTSVPSTIGLPLGITVKRSKARLFEQKAVNMKPVSLAHLLKNTPLRLGIAKGRSYTAEGDALIKKFGSESNVHVRAGRDVYHGLFKMLLNDRVDFIIGYPDEMLYIARSYSASDRILNLPIREFDRFSLGYIGCPKNRWGLEAAEKLSDVLRKIRPTAEYRSIIESWLDENSRIRLRKIYESHFLTPVISNEHP